MAWTFAQQNATLGAGVASQATAFPGNVAAGSLIVVAVHLNGTGTTVSSVTDTRGTTYTPVGPGMTTLAGLGAARLYWGVTPSAGACTVTVTPSVSDTVYVGVFEYQGVAASPFDVQAAATGSSTTPASGNATTATDNELAVGFCFASGTAAAGAGWSSRSTFNGDCFEDKNVTPAGAVSAAFTMAPTGSWIALEATFAQQVAAAVTAVAPRPLLMTLRRFAKPGLPIVGFPQPQPQADTAGALVLTAPAASFAADGLASAEAAAAAPPASLAANAVASAVGSGAAAGSFTASGLAVESESAAAVGTVTVSAAVAAVGSGAAVGTMTVSGLARESQSSTTVATFTASALAGAVSQAAVVATSTFSALTGVTVASSSAPATVTFSSPAAAADSPTAVATSTFSGAAAAVEQTAPAAALVTFQAQAQTGGGLNLQSPASLATFSGVATGGVTSTAGAAAAFSGAAAAAGQAQTSPGSVTYSSLAAATLAASASATVTASAATTLAERALALPGTATFSAVVQELGAPAAAFALIGVYARAGVAAGSRALAGLQAVVVVRDQAYGSNVLTETGVQFVTSAGLMTAAGARFGSVTVGVRGSAGVGAAARMLSGAAAGVRARP